MQFQITCVPVPPSPATTDIVLDPFAVNLKSGAGAVPESVARALERDAKSHMGTVSMSMEIEEPAKADAAKAKKRKRRGKFNSYSPPLRLDWRLDKVCCLNGIDAPAFAQVQERSSSRRIAEHFARDAFHCIRAGKPDVAHGIARHAPVHGISAENSNKDGCVPETRNPP